MYKNITELKNKHLGKDIWIVLAGSSMNYVSKSFFENKIVLGTNQVYKHFPCTYIVMKDCMERPRYTRSIQELKEKSIPLIFSEECRPHLCTKQACKNKWFQNRFD